MRFAALAMVFLFVLASVVPLGCQLRTVEPPKTKTDEPSKDDGRPKEKVWIDPADVKPG